MSHKVGAVMFPVAARLYLTAPNWRAVRRHPDRAPARDRQSRPQLCRYRRHRQAAHPPGRRQRREALDRDDAHAEAAEAPRGLINEVRHTPETDAGATSLRAELFGEIATIVAIGRADKRKLPEGEPSGSQLSLVAGARSQRYLQIVEGWIPRLPKPQTTRHVWNEQTNSDCR